MSRMGFFALGLNHTTASVALRERIAFVPEQLATSLRDACQTAGLQDLVILSTCNRTELYGLAESTEALGNWLANVHELQPSEVQPHLYEFQHEQALTHLIRVSSGLDSMMLGEPQILGQVKSAVQIARNAGTVTPVLGRIFDLSFQAAKQVRTETSIGVQAVSLGYAVSQLARQVFSDLRQSTALIVAAGEMNALVARHLIEQQLGHVIICNRTAERATLLAEELAGRGRIEIIPFDRLGEHLHRADIVSSCTGSLHPVIELAMVKQALKQRRHAPMLLVDLAVPRDIEPRVGELEDAYLYTLDDLQAVIEDGMANRRIAAQDAEALVRVLSRDMMQRYQSRQATPYIRQYRDQAEQIRLQELARARLALEQGQPIDEILERLSQSLTAKLIHGPTQLLRETVTAGQEDQLAEMLGHLGVADANRTHPSPERIHPQD